MNRTRRIATAFTRSKVKQAAVTHNKMTQLSRSN